MSLDHDICGRPQEAESYETLANVLRGRARRRRRLAACLMMLLAFAALGASVARSVGGLEAARRLDRLDQIPAPGLDPNRASARQLAEWPGSSSGLARRIVAYRVKIGPIRHREDLLRIPGLTQNRWRDLHPYLEIKAP